MNECGNDAECKRQIEQALRKQRESMYSDFKHFIRKEGAPMLMDVKKWDYLKKKWGCPDNANNH